MDLHNSRWEEDGVAGMERCREFSGAAFGVTHGFIPRVAAVDVTGLEREEAIRVLEPHHHRLLATDGHSGKELILCEQVHGNRVATVRGGFGAGGDFHQGADGLVTDDPRLVLGIYVADCCAVYLADPYARVVALCHSGKKGTELGIVKEAVGLMRNAFGCKVYNLVAALGPCIRPPRYEVDFAAEIRRQLSAAGVPYIFDPGVCTAARASRYYSYRTEKGKTGRMLAFIGLA
jgi:copper oxidase (laccase) domain-containing protein